MRTERQRTHTPRGRERNREKLLVSKPSQIVSFHFVYYYHCSSSYWFLVGVVELDFLFCSRFNRIGSNCESSMLFNYWIWADFIICCLLPAIERLIGYRWACLLVRLHQHNRPEEHEYRPVNRVLFAQPPNQPPRPPNRLVFPMLFRLLLEFLNERKHFIRLIFLKMIWIWVQYFFFWSWSNWSSVVFISVRPVKMILRWKTYLLCCTAFKDHWRIRRRFEYIIRRISLDFRYIFNKKALPSSVIFECLDEWPTHSFTSFQILSLLWLKSQHSRSSTCCSLPESVSVPHNGSLAKPPAIAWTAPLSFLRALKRFNSSTVSAKCCFGIFSRSCDENTNEIEHELKWFGELELFYSMQLILS